MSRFFSINTWVNGLRSNCGKALFIIVFGLFSAWMTASLYASVSDGNDGDGEYVHRTFDQEALEAFKEQKEFIYEKPPQKTGWSDFWSKLFKWLDSFQTEGSSTSALGTIAEYSMYILAILCVLFVADRWLKLNAINNLFSRQKGGTAGITFKEEEEDIHEISFDERIAEAIEQQQYRRAVRLYYLKCLKMLADEKMINWRIDKTNRDYQLELMGTEVESDFRKATYLFEYVWYGEFAVNKQNFQELSEQLIRFEQQIAK